MFEKALEVKEGKKGERKSFLNSLVSQGKRVDPSLFNIGSEGVGVCCWSKSHFLPQTLPFFVPIFLISKVNII